MNLFNVYRGEILEIDELTHLALGKMFPEVDRPSEYRSIDAWLWANPRRRPKSNIRKFIVTWFSRCKRKEEGAEYVLSDGVKCRVTSADRRAGRVR
jgi:hypothetical protein